MVVVKRQQRLLLLLPLPLATTTITSSSNHSLTTIHTTRWPMVSVKTSTIRSKVLQLYYKNIVKDIILREIVLAISLILHRNSSNNINNHHLAC